MYTDNKAKIKTVLRGDYFKMEKGVKEGPIIYGTL